MARLIQQRAYPTLRLAGNLDIGRLFFAAVQIAVMGGIGAFIALAILNTILGTPQEQPVYSPYQG